MISIVAAMTEDRVIGRNNKLPWHISDDLKRFKTLTMGHPIIMGRKTFESIGRALPGRKNIVISGTPGFSVPGVDVAASLTDALALSASDPERFVIGGARVFAEALPLADKLYLTFVHGQFEGDVRFPEFDLRRDFKVIENIPGRTAPPDRLSYSFVTAVRNK